MNRKELIKKYIEFFKSKNHKEIPNASLLPVNDPTVLFTTAGMQPIVPYLTGQVHPSGKRLVNVQKCIRTGDIEEVGDTYHHTFFEMLGNWSLGDYWKEEAIKLTFEFHTKILKIPLERYAVSVFKGNKNAPVDEESIKFWKNLGISEDRIAKIEESNWWGPAGNTGPCGPSTEMFYWKPNNKSAPKKFDSNDSNWVEIGNDVLMEYLKNSDGKIISAKQKNIDFGGGVERTIATLNNLEDNYEADMWKPLIEEIEKISSKKYKENKEITKAMRIIADHIKASCFIINDGVTPSNTEQGYVLRRLIRRAIRFGRILGLEKFTKSLGKVVFKIYDDYPWNSDRILEELEKEEERFLKTLEQGLKVFEKLSSKKIEGKEAFLLYQSFGFPIEMTLEEAKSQGLEVDLKGYEEELKKHQELSRTATEGKFKSGLADHSEATTRLHTATHLLLSAMNKVLEIPKGLKEISQRGSNITAERARFDFSYDRKLTDEEVKKIEDLVNSWIKTGSVVKRLEMNLEEARKSGANGVFDEKYKAQDVISVYSIGEGKISHELCTGPHVSSLKDLQDFTFKITKQESVGAGNRRVKVELIPKK